MSGSILCTSKNQIIGILSERKQVTAYGNIVTLEEYDYSTIKSSLISMNLEEKYLDMIDIKYFKTEYISPDVKTKIFIGKSKEMTGMKKFIEKKKKTNDLLQIKLRKLGYEQSSQYCGGNTYDYHGKHKQSTKRYEHISNDITKRKHKLKTKNNRKRSHPNDNNPSQRKRSRISTANITEMKNIETDDEDDDSGIHSMLSVGLFNENNPHKTIQIIQLRDTFMFDYIIFTLYFCNQRDDVRDRWSNDTTFKEKITTKWKQSDSKHTQNHINNNNKNNNKCGQYIKEKKIHQNKSRKRSMSNNNDESPLNIKVTPRNNEWIMDQHIVSFDGNNGNKRKSIRQKTTIKFKK